MTMKPGSLESGPRQAQEAGSSEAIGAPKPETNEPGQLSPEQTDQAAYWLAQTQRELEEKAREKADIGPEERERMASELSTLFEAWLAPERLEALHALMDEAEALANPLRQEAKLALAEIRKRMDIVGDAGSKDKYKLVSRAVGIINGGKVDHNR